MTEDCFPQKFNPVSPGIILGSSVGRRWQEIVSNSMLGTQCSN